MKKHEKFLTGLVVVFVATVLVMGVAGAQAGPGTSPIPTPTATAVPPTPIEPGDIPELPALLGLLAGPQGWVILGVLVSMGLAKWPWYNAQASQIKQAIFVGATAVLSILAYVLVTYVPAAVWAATAPFWGIVAGIVMTWMGGNGWYALGVKAQKPRIWKWEPLEEITDSNSADSPKVILG